MTDAPASSSSLSPGCLSGDHESCIHWAGGGYVVAPKLLGGGSYDRFCVCPCHGTCPVSGRRPRAAFDAWLGTCTCPAALEPRLEAQERLVTSRVSRTGPYSDRSHPEREVSDEDHTADEADEATGEQPERQVSPAFYLALTGYTLTALLAGFFALHTHGPLRVGLTVVALMGAGLLVWLLLLVVFVELFSRHVQAVLRRLRSRSR